MFNKIVRRIYTDLILAWELELLPTVKWQMCVVVVTKSTWRMMIECVSMMLELYNPTFHLTSNSSHFTARQTHYTLQHVKLITLYSTSNSSQLTARRNHTNLELNVCFALQQDSLCMSFTWLILYKIQQMLIISSSKPRKISMSDYCLCVFLSEWELCAALQLQSETLCHSCT